MKIFGAPFGGGGGGSCGARFIEKLKDFDTRIGCSFFKGIFLNVGEGGGDRYHRSGDLLSEEIFRGLDERFKEDGVDL